MIVITPSLSIDDDEVRETFVRASGPGGQHVNKTSTAVELRFNARRSPNLPDDVAVRLMRLAGSRLTIDGEIVIFAQSHRSQLRNREEALARLVAMITEATVRPRHRVKTRVSKASKAKRLESKGLRSGVKATRSRPISDA